MFWLKNISSFYSIFDITLRKQIVETLIRHRILSRLIWVCTIFLCPIKLMLGFIWVKVFVFTNSCLLF